MSSKVANLKKILKTTIQDMAHNKNQFTQSPGKDFTRKRKLEFTSVISVLLSMSGGSTASNLMDYFKFDSTAVSTSAFVQQRAKLKPEAMEYLFRRFTQKTPAKKSFHGYRLLAVDGSDLKIFTSPMLSTSERQISKHTSFLIGYLFSFFSFALEERPENGNVLS